MKKSVLLLVAAVSFVALAPFAHAYPPPGQPYHLVPVRWIIHTSDDLDKDDRYVTIIGQVTGRTGDETYFFSDGTGTIRLDSEKFELPVGPKLVIGGRIDQAYLGFGHLEVDVRNWHYAHH